jgi:hypothetical protein
MNSERTNSGRRDAMRTSGRLAFALLAGLALTGCGSAFVGGGVATATVSDGRVAVDSRTASARTGLGGGVLSTQRRQLTTCRNGTSGAWGPC